MKDRHFMEFFHNSLYGDLYGSLLPLLCFLQTHSQKLEIFK